MKPLATLDIATLVILKCAYRDKLWQPNKLEAKSIDAIAADATALLALKYTLSGSIVQEAANRVRLSACFDNCNTYDGKGEVRHAQINQVGEVLMLRLEDEDRAERRHSEIVRVARVSALVAAIAALAAIASAWYAKSQADSAALSARASAASIVSPPALQVEQSPSSGAAHAPIGSAAATPKKP